MLDDWNPPPMMIGGYTPRDPGVIRWDCWDSTGYKVFFCYIPGWKFSRKVR